MSSEDGKTFIKNLAHLIRTHEKALANASQTRSLRVKKGQAKGQGASSLPTIISGNQASVQSSTASLITSALTLGAVNLRSQHIKYATLTLTPHHLYYLLCQVEDLGVPIGPMNVRLENLHAETSPANYVSFLQSYQSSKGPRSDRDSMHSVSSIRSWWSGTARDLAADPARSEKISAQFETDRQYLYSACTKIPSLHLSPDHKARQICGYEEFPFDTAVPLLAFKNLTVLEIADVDFRQFFGWHVLSDQLRSLSVKRARLVNPADLLTCIVVADGNNRRRRSSVLQFPKNLPGNRPCSSPTEISMNQDSLPNVPGYGCDICHDTSSQTNTAVQNVSDSTAANIRRSRYKSMPIESSPVLVETEHLQESRQSDHRKLHRSESHTSNLSQTSVRHRSSGSIAGGLAPINSQFPKWQFLRHLCIADNSLESLPPSCLSPLSGTLLSLDISYNLFTRMPEEVTKLVALQALNISNCIINSLHISTLWSQSAITSLNIRANSLRSLSGIEKFTSLRRLDIRENKLEDLTEIDRLTSLPYMKELWVVKNPFVTLQSSYRVKIFRFFRAAVDHEEDILLDCLGPTYGEKRQLQIKLHARKTQESLKPCISSVSGHHDGFSYVNTQCHRSFPEVSDDRSPNNRPPEHMTVKLEEQNPVSSPANDYLAHSKIDSSQSVTQCESICSDSTQMLSKSKCRDTHFSHESKGEESIHYVSHASIKQESVLIPPLLLSH